ncbi:DUF262 domain-containing protein [Aliarcobacter butzleri]|uniref:DUF262 domain-containing protein n=1 Tax=Aliarcobacter butzleri TaxID=28197 RepID=UPI00263D3D70|nr:DUF262 domain-containing protein [Aliarcobacter butzleri]MDN5046623.1 DUF262 domain-containing protein [Aliarcobacter butzleri]
MSKEKAVIIKLKNLLSIENLDIPEYQRPYKWSLKNVNQLIDDILRFKNKEAYRLGTVVVHKNSKNNTLDIVDGQQRITTIVLLIKAIMQDDNLNKKFHTEYNEKSENEIKFPDLKFTNPISITNVKQNFQELNKRIKEIEFDENVVYFILRKCEVVYVELDDISEAFQFFDSQNARGKDLAPHDLLKAFHLREMNDVSESEKTLLVNSWEQLDEEGNLSGLFNDYLFKIRNWSRGKSARYFSKNDVDIFKGISINKDTKELYPYVLLYQMANVFVDDYNLHSSRKVDLNTLVYPYSLDLPVLNGKRFFQMISHYHKRIDQIKAKKENEIIKLLDTYKGNSRVGDRYVRLLFECALIYYIDKFGEQEIDKVIKKFFIWAYKLRLELQAVRLASVDNRALDTNVFETIKDANIHSKVVNLYISNLEKINYGLNDKDGIGKLIEEFKNLGYYNG